MSELKKNVVQISHLWMKKEIDISYIMCLTTRCELQNEICEVKDFRTEELCIEYIWN